MKDEYAEKIYANLSGIFDSDDPEECARRGFVVIGSVMLTILSMAKPEDKHIALCSMLQQITRWILSNEGFENDEV